MKSMQMPDELWEELTKLKLEWKNPTLSDVIVRLLEEYQENAPVSFKSQINTIPEENMN